MKAPVQPSEQAAMRRLLVQLRIGVGMSQTTLAARLGMTQSIVSKFERGERKLDEPRLQAWLHALEIEWTPFADALDRELGRVDAIVD